MLDAAAARLLALYRQLIRGVADVSLISNLPNDFADVKLLNCQ